jgi:hypothetical protein
MSILGKTKKKNLVSGHGRFEMIGLTDDFLPDRFLSSLAGEEEDWAD